MVNEKIIVELSAEIKGLKSQLNTAQSDLKSFPIGQSPST